MNRLFKSLTPLPCLMVRWPLNKACPSSRTGCRLTWNGTRIFVGAELATEMSNRRVKLPLPGRDVYSTSWSDRDRELLGVILFGLIPAWRSGPKSQRSPGVGVDRLEFPWTAHCIAYRIEGEFLVRLLEEWLVN